MCGLLGLWDIRKDLELTNFLERGLLAMSWRGPDAKGHWQTEKTPFSLGLGHARLSILDLTDAGIQPMHSSDGSWTMVFNGEIYNYLELREELEAEGISFKTRTDTEVLLESWKLWGRDCLRRLDGMFVFAVFSHIHQTIEIYRDPFGIKPLYFFEEGGRFGFSSEIGALLALSGQKPRLNWNSAYRYLVFGEYDDSRETFFEGLYCLSPGAGIALDCKSGNIRKHQWWEPSVKQSFQGNFEQASEEFRHKFVSSVQRQLRSDVPLGAALSGGLDSSAVVCVMRHLEPDVPIHTFSYVARGSHLNEENWVDLITGVTKAHSYRVEVQASELFQDLDELILTQGEPFGSTSIYAQYRVYQLARAQGITVTLDGQGADELLAGYSGFPGYRMRSLMEEGQFGAAGRFYQNWRKGPGRSPLEPLRTLGRWWIPEPMQGLASSLAGDSGKPFWLNAGSFLQRGVRMVRPQPVHTYSEPGRRLMGRQASALVGWGLPALLRHGDRNSMHFSVESRVPFLNLEITEFLFSLPEDFLISDQGESKTLMRHALRGIVPNEVLERKDKIGFATPGEDWLWGMQEVESRALGALDRIPVFEAGGLRPWLEDMRLGKIRFDWSYWRILNFLRWVDLLDVDC